MRLVERAFRFLIAALVAVPLGPGGICCCVVGGDGACDESAVAVVAPADEAHSCCSGLPPVSSADSAEPSADRPGNECDCPGKDAAVESSRTVVVSPSTADAVRIDRAEVPTVAAALEGPSPTRRVAVESEAPPRPPVRLLLSVFLC